MMSKSPDLQWGRDASSNREILDSCLRYRAHVPSRTCGPFNDTPSAPLLHWSCQLATYDLQEQEQFSESLSILIGSWSEWSRAGITRARAYVGPAISRSYLQGDEQAV